MRVSLAVHGGFTAALNLGRPPASVDSAALPRADAGRLADLVAAVRREPPHAPARPVPDEQTYAVTVEDDGSTEVFRASDTSMSQAFSDLLGFLQGRGQPRSG